VEPQPRERQGRHHVGNEQQQLVPTIDIPGGRGDGRGRHPGRLRRQQRAGRGRRFGQEPRPVLPRLRRGGHRTGHQAVREGLLEGQRVHQWITGTNFESKLFSSLLTKQAPDVFEFHPQLQLVKSGQVADLSDIIDPVKDDFNPADIASHTVDGKIYGVRMIDDPQFFYYRKSMLEKAGVEVPRPSTSCWRPPPSSPPARSRACSRQRLHAVQGNLIWSAGADTLNDKNEIAYHTDAVVEGSSSSASCSPAATCCSTPRPTTGTRPPSTRACAPSSGAVCGPCRHAEGARRRPRHLPVPEGRRLGQAVGLQRRLVDVRQRQGQERRRGQGVREVAVDRPEEVPGGLGAQLRLPHPAAHLDRRVRPPSSSRVCPPRASSSSPTTATSTTSPGPRR
jgi:hypothetical protein